MRPDVVELELQADEEQQEDQAELRDHGEDFGQHRVGERLLDAGQRRAEHRGEQLRAQPPEQRRAEEQPGDDLADHARLPDLPGQRPERPRRGDDDRQLHEHRQEQVFDIEVGERLGGFGEERTHMAGFPLPGRTAGAGG